MSDISTKQFLVKLEKEINRLGGNPEAARAWGVPASFVRSVRKGAELPGEKILKAMNLKPVRTIKYRYERINP